MLYYRRDDLHYPRWHPCVSSRSFFIDKSRPFSFIEQPDMDPLSITASCITVVATGGSVVKGLKKLRDLNKIPEILLSIINEVADLTLVLQDIRLNFRRDSLHVPQSAVIVIEQLLERAQAELLELDQIINYRLLLPPKEKGELVFSRCAWISEERRVQQLQASLRTTRLDIAARFTALNL